jgi:hypothetical protein
MNISVVGDRCLPSVDVSFMWFFNPQIQKSCKIALTQPFGDPNYTYERAGCDDFHLTIQNNIFYSFVLEVVTTSGQLHKYFSGFGIGCRKVYLDNLK